MIHIYDQVLKRISNILDHCLTLTRRFQHIPKNTNDNRPPMKEETELIHLLAESYGLDESKKRIVHDALCIVQSSANEELQQIAEFLFSLCDIMFPDEPEAWQEAYDWIVKLKPPQPSEVDLEPIHVFDTLSAWLDHIQSSNNVSGLFGVRTSVQYHRDMDTELIVMQDDDYQNMVAQLNTMLQQYGAESLHLEESELSADHKNPFSHLGFDISQKYFEYKHGPKDSAGKSLKFTGLALIQINASDGGHWTDFVGIADFDQAIRLKSLFDVYYLSDKLHIWRGVKEWPTNNRLYCVSFMFPQVNDEREQMHRTLNHEVSHAEFSVEKNRSIFMEQLHDAFEFSDIFFEWNHRQAALRLRNVYEKLLKYASRSREPIQFEAFVAAMLEEGTRSGDALRVCEETLFEELAKDHASFSLQHTRHSVSDGDHFMEQYEEAMMHYKALMPPIRYAEMRLHGVAKIYEKSFDPQQFHIIIMRLLYDRGMLCFVIPAAYEEMSLEQCCIAWSAIIPDNLTLIVYEEIGHDDVLYIQILSGSYARHLYDILKHHKISSKMRVYIRGRRRIF